MATSPIYRSSSLYELAMLLLYRRHYGSRYRAIAELIPNDSSVLDLCCGPALLYHRYLRKKSVRYTGLDLNSRFIEDLIRKGQRGHVWDLRSDKALPSTDYVIMQGSFYHFLPDPGPMLERMLEAARNKVIIAEPIRNLTSSNSRLLSFLGRILTNPGAGEHQYAVRFNESSLDEFFSRYRSSVETSMLIAGGREKVYVLRP